VALPGAPPTPGGRPATGRQVVTRRYAALGTVHVKSGRGPSSVPGILSPRKITVKGAPCGRVAARWRKRHP